MGKFRNVAKVLKKFRDRVTHEVPTGPHTDVRKRKINPSYRKKLTGMGKGLSATDKHKKIVLGQDMSDKYKEIKVSNTQTGLKGRKVSNTQTGLKGRKKFQHGGRTNLLEELGRVEAEPSNRNRRAEVSRVHRELNRGYKSGGAVLKGKKVGCQIK